MDTSGETARMDVISELSSRAIHEYEGLQEECATYRMECERIKKERDEAVKKLKEFQRVSHMVIEEVSIIQDNLEIEKSCRQSAEALASKLNRQNRSLKRKSMQLLSHLEPDVIAKISLEGDEEDDSDRQPEDNRDNIPCSSGHCHKIITELRNKLALMLEAKAQVAIDLEEARERLREAREELLKEKHDNTVLIAKTIQQKELLAKYSRVSLLAVEEYEVLQGSLELEKDLRKEAENFARELLVEQKKLNRQSQILLKSVSPNLALQEAMDQVSKLSQVLEVQKLDHQKQMKAIQEQLQGSELQKEVLSLRRQMQLLEEEKRVMEERCMKSEVQVKDLQFRVEELQKRLQSAVNPIPGPPPPPPPPPPLPPPAAPSSTNPLSSLLSILRKKKQTSEDIPLVVQDSSGTEPAEKKVADIRQQAVDEMMQRIKKGVALRPVQRPSKSTRQPQDGKMPPDSAVQELKGILNAFRRESSVQYRERERTGPTQTELEKALHRRRCVVETKLQTQPDSHLSPQKSDELEKEQVKTETLDSGKTTLA